MKPFTVRVPFLVTGKQLFKTCTETNLTCENLSVQLANVSDQIV